MFINFFFFSFLFIEELKVKILFPKPKLSVSYVLWNFMKISVRLSRYKIIDRILLLMKNESADCIENY